MTAVFETMRVRAGAIPFLERHMARLLDNIEATGLPVFAEDVRATILAVTAARPDDHVVRAEWNGAELAITTRDIPPLEGLKLIMSSIVHPGYPIKTTERAAFDAARMEARERGADEAILVTADGFVAEGSIFAIGWFEGDVIRMPALDLDILPSIGRARVLECARSLGFVVEQGRFRVEDLLHRAAFATTSVRGVVPVATLDGRPVALHPYVDSLRDEFWT